MSDTARTEAALLALYADNSTGDISAQDLRDLVATVHNVDTVKIECELFGHVAAGAPAVVGSNAMLVQSYDVGEKSYPHLAMPVNWDPSRDIVFHLAWGPLTTNSSKLVSWDLQFVCVKAGTILTSVDDTIQVVDDTVPDTQYENSSSMFTIPAASLDADASAIHMGLTRVASSAEAGAIGVHHLVAVVPILPYNVAG